MATDGDSNGDGDAEVGHGHVDGDEHAPKVRVDRPFVT